MVPDAALGFFGLSEIELDVTVTRFLYARDHVLPETRRAARDLPTGGTVPALDLSFCVLDGETRMCRDEYWEFLEDACSEHEVDDPHALVAALDRHGDASGARARTAMLLEDERSPTTRHRSR